MNIDKKDKPTTFRTSQRILDIVAEMCEHDNRSRGMMIEYAILRYYNEIFKKEKRD